MYVDLFAANEARAGMRWVCDKSVYWRELLKAPTSYSNCTTARCDRATRMIVLNKESRGVFLEGRE